MSKQQKTKQGMASIYIVVFVTMLIGVITLSFLRIMLSETGRTEKSTLADSALNSAMAGVEDAKAILTKYHNCKPEDYLDRGSSCYRARAAVLQSDNEDCDLSGGLDSEKIIGDSNGSGEINDQAYTCVNITVKGDFEGKIDAENPVMVVPMRIDTNSTAESDAGGDINNVKGVKISWTSSESNAGMKEVGSISGGYNGNVNNSSINKGVLGEKGVIYDGSSDEPSAQNGLKVSLIQSGSSYNIDSFYSAASASETNRGTLMLLPSTNGTEEAIPASEFVNSADKTYNAPISIKCTNDTKSSCATTLNFPNPVGGARIQDTFFLVISRVYSEPIIDKITVTMIDGAGNPVDFFDVQPIVDSTGRAGDMMRRVEVRLNPDYGALVPLSELTVDGDLNKNFFVTKNCINGTTACE